MSKADIEMLRPMYDAISRMDWHAVFRDVHADFVLRTPDRDPAGEPFRGRDAAVGAFSDFFEPYQEVAVEPEQFLRRGDQIVVFFLLRSRPKGSTAVVEIRAGHLWTMRDGRPCRLQIFRKREDALEAADSPVS